LELEFQKNLTKNNLQKYTQANIDYYLSYVSGCHEYPTLEKLFFLDESHFEVRRLNRKGAGKVVRVVTLQNYDLGFDFLINSDDFTQIHAFLDLTLVLSVKSNNTCC